MFSKLLILIFLLHRVTVIKCACKCGQYNKTANNMNKYPMMALVFYDDNCREGICSATIIDDRHLITAANCFKSQEADRQSVAVGPFDSKLELPFSKTIYKITEVMPHEKYNTNPHVKALDHDICIITVGEKIKFNEFVLPACLPFNFIDTKLNKVLGIGWDLNNIKKPTEQELNLIVDKPEFCKDTYWAFNITERQMCTHSDGTREVQLLKGGAIHHLDPRTGKLILEGIAGWGSPFNGTNFHLDTRIVPMLDWIVKITRVSYCKV